MSFSRISVISCASPSVWREWIEMVDLIEKLETVKSPSVWREWIEISLSCVASWIKKVSLRVEGVD